MKFLIVIPTHNRHQSLINLLRSIEAQGLDHHEFEVIVVTNLKDKYLESEDFKT